MSEAAAKRPSAWRRFWRGVWLFILWLIRLLLAIGGGVVLGSAIFYVAYVGVPQFYSQVLNPIQVNSVRLDILQGELRSAQANMFAELQAARSEVRSLQDVVNGQMVAMHALQAELNAERESRERLLALLQADVRQVDEKAQSYEIALGRLEGDLRSAEERLSGQIGRVAADLQAAEGRIQAVTEAQQATQGRLGALEKEAAARIEALNGRLAEEATALGARLNAAEGELKANAGAVAELGQTLQTLQQDLQALAETMGAVQSEVLAFREVFTMPIALSDAFERRLVLMQAWQEILKARLHLLEKNAGYASRSLALARANVDQFVALSTDLSTERLAPVLKRLAEVDANLESDPFVAVQELEIIWHSLQQMIAVPVAPRKAEATPSPAPTGPAAPEAATPAATPSPAPTGATTPAATPSPAPTEAATPSPAPTEAATPTPMPTPGR